LFCSNRMRSSCYNSQQETKRIQLDRLSIVLEEMVIPIIDTSAWELERWRHTTPKTHDDLFPLPLSLESPFRQTFQKL
jgi:hypothetical protein